MDPLSGISIPFPQGSLGSTRGLQPGQLIQGRITSSGGQLTLVAGGNSIPLTGDSIATGAVTVSIQGTPENLQLLIRPTAPSGATVPLPQATALAAALLSLNHGGNPSQLTQLVPPGLAAHSQALLQIIRLLANPQPPRDDAALLLRHVKTAMTTGAVSQEEGALMIQTLQLYLAEAVPGASALERRWQTLLRNRTESILARATRSGLSEPTVPGPRTLLEHLLTSSGFRNFLDASGQGRGVEQALGRLLARAETATLQQLHALKGEYGFMELPNVDEFTGRVHFFLESQGRGHDQSLKAEAVLDLETTTLGALWVSLRLMGSACQCHFRVVEESTRALLEVNRPELESALRGAGYGHAGVSVSGWNGDRLNALAEAFTRAEGLEVQA